MQSSPLPCYPLPLRPKNLRQPLILEHTQSMSLNCATSRRVTGAISDGAIEIFHWLNPLASTMALGSTQPLTRNEYHRYLLGGKGGRCWQSYLVCRPSGNLGASTSWNSQGLFRPVQGLPHRTLRACSDPCRDCLLELSGPVQTRAGTVLQYRQFFLIPNRKWWISERTVLSPASISPAISWSISHHLRPFSFTSILHCLHRSTGYSKAFSNNSSHFKFLGNSLTFRSLMSTTVDVPHR